MLRVLVPGLLLLLGLLVACSGNDDSTDGQFPEAIPSLEERVDLCDRLYPPNADFQRNRACVSAAAGDVEKWRCYVRYAASLAPVELLCSLPSGD